MTQRVILEYGSTVEAAEVRGMPSSRAHKRAVAIVLMLVAVAACVAAVGIFTPTYEADELEVREGSFGAVGIIRSTLAYIRLL